MCAMQLYFNNSFCVLIVYGESKSSCQIKIYASNLGIFRQVQFYLLGMILIMFTFQVICEFSIKYLMNEHLKALCLNHLDIQTKSNYENFNLIFLNITNTIAKFPSKRYFLNISFLTLS